MENEVRLKTTHSSAVYKVFIFEATFGVAKCDITPMLEKTTKTLQIVGNSSSSCRWIYAWFGDTL